MTNTKHKQDVLRCWSKSSALLYRCARKLSCYTIVNVKATLSLEYILLMFFWWYIRNRLKFSYWCYIVSVLVHAPSKSWRLKAYRLPSAFVYGLSATNSMTNAVPNSKISLQPSTFTLHESCSVEAFPHEDSGAYHSNKPLFTHHHHSCKKRPKL